MRGNIDIQKYRCVIIKFVTQMNKTVEKIPTWAFGYIFNGDMTGLTDEELTYSHT